VRSGDDLAETCQADGDALYRLLRALASIDVTEEPTPQICPRNLTGEKCRLHGTNSALEGGLLRSADETDGIGIIGRMTDSHTS
jgi:hypothetical protein